MYDLIKLVDSTIKIIHLRSAVDEVDEK